MAERSKSEVSRLQLFKASRQSRGSRMIFCCWSSDPRECGVKLVLNRQIAWKNATSSSLPGGLDRVCSWRIRRNCASSANRADFRSEFCHFSHTGMLNNERVFASVFQTMNPGHEQYPTYRYWISNALTRNQLFSLVPILS